MDLDSENLVFSIKGAFVILIPGCIINTDGVSSDPEDDGCLQNFKDII